jgi:hypothetical protein
VLTDRTPRHAARTASRRTARTLVVLAVLAGVTAWAPSAEAGRRQGADCTAPILPLVAYDADRRYPPVREQTYPDHPVAIPDLAAGVDLDLTRDWMLARPDTDGDGVVDQVDIDLSSGEQVLVVTRGDGVVRVGYAGRNIGALTNQPVGDLAADGRDELLFLARDPVDGSDRTFVLPGTTPVGEHQVLDVAVEVPDTYLVAAGDQVDGPGLDVIVHEITPGGLVGHVISGQDLMAPGPGRAADVTPRAWSVPGRAVAVVDVGDPRPAIVSNDLRLVTEEQGRFVLTRSGQQTVFVTAGPRARTLFAATAFQVDDHRYLLASAGDRGGTSVVMWDLEDPCLGLPPVTHRPPPSTTTTVAPPTTTSSTTTVVSPGGVRPASGASPRSGRPRFTG